MDNARIFKAIAQIAEPVVRNAQRGFPVTMVSAPVPMAIRYQNAITNARSTCQTIAIAVHATTPVILALPERHAKAETVDAPMGTSFRDAPVLVPTT